MSRIINRYLKDGLSTEIISKDEDISGCMLRGWIKKEMYINFDINNYNTVQEFIDNVVCDNNNYRPTFALQYKTLVGYRTQLGFK